MTGVQTCALPIYNKIVSKKSPFNFSYGSEVGGQYLHDGIYEHLKKIKASNEEFKRSGNLIYDANDIAQTLQDLNTARGEYTPQRKQPVSFDQQLQYNMQNFR